MHILGRWRRILPLRPEIRLRYVDIVIDILTLISRTSRHLSLGTLEIRIEALVRVVKRAPLGHNWKGLYLNCRVGGVVFLTGFWIYLLFNFEYCLVMVLFR